MKSRMPAVSRISILALGFLALPFWASVATAKGENAEDAETGFVSNYDPELAIRASTVKLFRLRPDIGSSSRGGSAGGVSAGGNYEWLGVNSFTSTLKVFQTTTHTGDNWIGIAHNGTNAVLTTGAGGIVLPNGSFTGPVPALRFSGANTGWVSDSGNWAFSNNNNAAVFNINSDGHVKMHSEGVYQFSNAVNNSTAATDSGVARVAAGVIKPTAGGFGTSGWFQNTSGRSTLAADYTNETATFSNTALSITVKSGRKYTFKLGLFLSDSVGADGAKLDFNGGTATATSFRVHCTVFDTALLLSSQATALGTAFTVGTLTGSGLFECYGSLEPSADGTFIVRAAQNVHTTGTLTVFRGSHLWVEDMP